MPCGRKTFEGDLNEEKENKEANTTPTAELRRLVGDSMKKATCVIALFVLLAACAPKSSVAPQESDFIERLYANDPARKMIGASLPAIQFKDVVTGKSMSFTDFNDRVVLINSLVLGCPSCLEEIPKLNQLHDKYGNKLSIIEVDINPRDSAEQLLKVKKELQGRDFVWTISSEAGEALQMAGPDVTYIAKNGKIVYADSMVVSIERLEKFIEEALK